MDALRKNLLRNFKKGPQKALKAVHSSKVKPIEGVLIRGDIVGKPNPISNIRPITFHVPQNETLLEREFRLKREQVQDWHEEFWRHHNTRFMEERKDFIQTKLLGKKDETSLSSDEISIFYKAFLDKYWTTHIWYNFEWYKKNINLLALAFRVELERFKRKMLD